MNPLHKKPTKDGYITPDEYYVELEHWAARAEKSIEGMEELLIDIGEHAVLGNKLTPEIYRRIGERLTMTRVSGQMKIDNDPTPSPLCLLSYNALRMAVMSYGASVSMRWSGSILSMSAFILW